MHNSSRMKAECFRDAHLAPVLDRQGGLRLLEVGSKSYHDHDTFRGVFADSRIDYVGLDVEDGPHVDIVPARAYVWEEIADDSFDACVSGQTFEHNPFFWVTFCEIARVLKPGAAAFVVAPGAGATHRYPYDCWRFYADAWRALCALSGMEGLESWYEPDDLARQVEGGGWRDSAVIARKPALEGAALAAFNARLRELCAPYAGFGFELPEIPMQRAGVCFDAYARRVEAARPRGLKGWLHERKMRRKIPKVYAPE